MAGAVANWVFLRKAWFADGSLRLIHLIPECLNRLPAPGMLLQSFARIVRCDSLDDSRNCTVHMTKCKCDVCAVSTLV